MGRVRQLEGLGAVVFVAQDGIRLQWLASQSGPGSS